MFLSVSKMSFCFFLFLFSIVGIWGFGALLVTITQPESINIWTTPLFIGFYFSRQHLTALWSMRSNWASLCSEVTAWNEFVTSVKQWIVMNNNGCFSSSQILYSYVSYVIKSDRIFMMDCSGKCSYTLKDMSVLNLKVPSLNGGFPLWTGLRKCPLLFSSKITYISFYTFVSCKRLTVWTDIIATLKHKN